MTVSFRLEWSEEAGFTEPLRDHFSSRERACEFGDSILAVDMPLSKICFYCGLLPGVLRGEDEFLGIGVAEVSLSTL